MPEILEIEMYRRAAEAVVGRRIADVHAPDDWFLKGIDTPSVVAALTGATIVGLDRVGKLLLIETDRSVIGLRFGMTGRLIVDGEPVISRLEYSTPRLDPGWERFGLDFAGGGAVRINDPRRLGGVLIDPDLGGLGTDAWALTSTELRALVHRTRRPCKALLLDQSRIAGLGNLLADELCWRVGVYPGTPCDLIEADALAAMEAAIVPMLDELYERGGSHLGDHVEARAEEAPCPRDGAPMRHATIAGRSTWWCREHQGFDRTDR